MKGGENILGLEYILQLYGLNNSDLARELDISRQNISIWLNGTRKIPKKYLPILSEKFNIPKEYFQKELNDVDKLKLDNLKTSRQQKYIQKQYSKKQLEELKIKELNLIQEITEILNPFNDIEISDNLLRDAIEGKDSALFFYSTLTRILKNDSPMAGVRSTVTRKVLQTLLLVFNMENKEVNKDEYIEEIIPIIQQEVDESRIQLEKLIKKFIDFLEKRGDLEEARELLDGLNELEKYK